MPLCQRCSGIFAFAALRPHGRCEKCGKPLVSEIGLCSACRNSPVVSSAERIFPLQTYRLWKKDLLFSWKMLDRRALSPYFARLVSRKISQIERINNMEKNSLPIVPVPPRPGKIRERGWDQIDELCRLASSVSSRKILPVLERLSKIQQKKLDRSERLETIGSAYRAIPEEAFLKVCGGKPPDCAVLVDDVMTTGATLEDCAKILKEMGVSRVFCVTLFVVD